MVELESDHLGSNPGATTDYLADLGQVAYLFWVTSSHVTLWDFFFNSLVFF